MLVALFLLDYVMKGNRMPLCEFQNENKTTILFIYLFFFLVCKIYSFCFDLMIHCVLQNWIFFCGLIFETWQWIWILLEFFFFFFFFLEYDNVIHIISTCWRKKISLKNSIWGLLKFEDLLKNFLKLLVKFYHLSYFNVVASDISEI